MSTISSTANIGVSVPITNAQPVLRGTFAPQPVSSSSACFADVHSESVLSPVLRSLSSSTSSTSSTIPKLTLLTDWIATDIQPIIFSYLDLAGQWEWDQMETHKSFLWRDVSWNNLYHPRLTIFDVAHWEAYVNLKEHNLDFSDLSSPNPRNCAQTIMNMLSLQFERNAGVTLLVMPKGLTIVSLSNILKDPKYKLKVRTDNSMGNIASQTKNFSIPLEQSCLVTIANHKSAMNALDNNYNRGQQYGFQHATALEASTLITAMELLYKNVVDTSSCGVCRKNDHTETTLNAISLQRGGPSMPVRHSEHLWGNGSLPVIENRFKITLFNGSLRVFDKDHQTWDKQVTFVQRFPPNQT